MANFILFDKLCEESCAKPFVNSAKELLKKLDLEISVENSFKEDLGFKTKAINEKAFYTNIAYNLSIAAHDNLDIVCIDDSSYLAFKQTQKTLKKDEQLQESINKALDIELNIDTNIIHLAELVQKHLNPESITTPFTKFRASIYEGPNAIRLQHFGDMSFTCKLLQNVKAQITRLESAQYSDGYEILEANPQIAYKLAGTVLLNAFDNAADFLVTNDVTTFLIFDTKQKAIAKEMGRDIDLSILNIYQILLLALGQEDKTKLALDTHKVDVTLI